jgi:hypothetical protein
VGLKRGIAIDTMTNVEIRTRSSPEVRVLVIFPFRGFSFGATLSTLTIPNLRVRHVYFVHTLLCVLFSLTQIQSDVSTHGVFPQHLRFFSSLAHRLRFHVGTLGVVKDLNPTRHLAILLD